MDTATVSPASSRSASRDVWSPRKDDVRYRISLRDGGAPDAGCFYNIDPTSGEVWTITIIHGEIETAVKVYQ